ncbi:MAG: tetraacyldisaccharide 4'-kinase [Planctomycetia bacterium]
MNEATYRKIISGEARGPGSGVLRLSLLLLSWAYTFVVRLRNWLYDTGRFRIHKAPVPVISVGNLTTGGTGKTPVTALLCQRLQQLGLHPGIISRGYRAADADGNDEKKVLRILVPDVPHSQNPDRLRAVAQLRNSTDSQLLSAIVMDDGLQHRRLHRDLNLILVDATNPFGYGHLLPRGLLREPLTGLQRADLVLVTRCEQVPEWQLEQLEQTIFRIAAHLRGKTVRIRFEPTGLRNQAGQRTEISALNGSAVFLMSGIGNPEAFMKTCELAGLKITGVRWFPDHHHFTAEDLHQVKQLAREAGAAIVITTLKDLVKIPFEEAGFQALEIEAVVSERSGRELLDQQLRTIFHA